MRVCVSTINSGGMYLEQWTDPHAYFTAGGHPSIGDVHEVGGQYVEVPDYMVRQYMVAHKLMAQAEQEIRKYLKEKEEAKEMMAQMEPPPLEVPRKYRDCGCSVVDGTVVELCDTHEAIREAEGD